MSPIVQARQERIKLYALQLGMKVVYVSHITSSNMICHNCKGMTVCISLEGYDPYLADLCQDLQSIIVSKPSKGC